MPFNQAASQASNTFGTYNDIQRDQHVYHGPVYQSYPSGTPQQPSLPSETTPRYLHKPTMPSPPELMIGRDNEKENIVDTLLQNVPARVAVTGGGGMGKTTLALSILHDLSVANQFPSRYFVTCEGVLSISSLVEEIANTLRIPVANRNTFLIDTIFSSFPDKALLCLDNFETLWDDEALRPDLEEFLSALQHKVFGLIITMRGAQLPSRVSWSKPVLPPLRPLTGDIPRRIFEGMTRGSVDKFVEKLLIAADGIPLAISLISASLREGHESSRSLWSRWTQAKSSALESGGRHRLSNLNASIHLSVYGPRMRADPTTIDILAMLSVLPDGFPNDTRAVEELQRHLPERYDLRKALLTLQRVSLVHVDEVAVPHRLRMLSPIISFCQHTLQGSEDLRNGITSYYVQLLDHFEEVTDPNGHAVIPSEMHNLHAVLMQAWKQDKGDASVMMASLQFTLWSAYLGNPVEEVVRAAMMGVVSEPKLQGDCRFVMGKVHLQRNELDDAEAMFKRAIQLHRQAHHVHGEGNDLQNLGEVHFRRGNLDDAEAIFKRAAELHRRAYNVHGEGRSLHELGQVHLQRGNLDDAEAMFKRAIELHRRIYDVHGEGHDLQNLGLVHLRRNELDEAEALLERAVQLHRQAHDVLGEGNDLQNLGLVHLQRNELDEAEALLERAVQLHRQAHDVLGEGNDLQNLGLVHLQRNELDEAEALLERAIELHRQAHDVIGGGYDLQRLEEVHQRRSELSQQSLLVATSRRNTLAASQIRRRIR